MILQTAFVCNMGRQDFQTAFRYGHAGRQSGTSGRCAEIQIREKDMQAGEQAK